MDGESSYRPRKRIPSIVRTLDRFNQLGIRRIVGAMYYLDHRYRPNSALGPDDVVEEAEVPSSSGAVGFDWAQILSLSHLRSSDSIQQIDRGWALEQVWRGAPASLNPQEPAIDEKFSDWRNALRQGKLPAVVFNATNVYRDIRCS